MYLELVYNVHEMQSKSFFAKFSTMQETFHEADILALGNITNRAQLSAENIFRPLSNCLLSSTKSKFSILYNFDSVSIILYLWTLAIEMWKCFSIGSASNLYVVRMSREAQSLLKRFLQEKRLKLVQNIVNDRLFVEVYDGIPRGKTAINSIAGHFMGEVNY